MNSNEFGFWMMAFFGAAAVIAAIFISLPVALAVFVVFAACKLYMDNPARHERLAKEQTLQIYDQVMAATTADDDFDAEGALISALPYGMSETARHSFANIGAKILAEEDITPDIPDPPAVFDSIEGARYRDLLSKYGQSPNRSEAALEAIRIIGTALGTVARHIPREEGAYIVPVSAFIKNPAQAVDDLVLAIHEENNYGLFKDLKAQIARNMHDISPTKIIYPKDYPLDDVVERYLKDTPLQYVFAAPVACDIPDKTRFEHMYVLGGTGAGKTTALKRFIAQDMADVLAGEKSVVVMDSQDELIPELMRVEFPKEKMVVIDVTDIDYPVALNLFGMGRERWGEYTNLQREQLRTSLTELYEFVLASLLDVGLSGQQQIMFRYCIRAMMEMEDATLTMFLDLLEDGGTDRHQDAIERLDGVARQFFDTQFDNDEFQRQRRAVLRRLYGVLESGVLERMFRNPACKLDMFAELQAGKLILINTSEQTLSSQGTATFGRFMLAMIAQAMTERSMIHANDRLPTFVYLDEAWQYLDANVGKILTLGRRRKVGLVLAHQDLGQITTKGLQSSIDTNTSIKLASRLSASDAAHMARNMGCEGTALQQRPTFNFMTFVAGLFDQAVPIEFRLGWIEKLPKRDDMDELKAYQRTMYSSVEVGEPDEQVPDEDVMHGDNFTMKDNDPTFRDIFDEKVNSESSEDETASPEPTKKSKRRKPRKSKKSTKFQTPPKDDEAGEW